MNCQIKNKKGKNRVLKFEGDLTVNNSVEIKGFLKKLFEDEGNFSIDHSSVSSFDFSYIQLLASFQFECEQQGKKLSFSGNIPQELKNAVSDSGFVNQFDFSKINEQGQ